MSEKIIVLCVRWYLRYCLSCRDLEEIMAERGVNVDHSTIVRSVVHYAPVLNELIRREMRAPKLKQSGNLSRRCLCRPSPY